MDRGLGLRVRSRGDPRGRDDRPAREAARVLVEWLTERALARCEGSATAPCLLLDEGRRDMIDRTIDVEERSLRLHPHASPEERRASDEWWAATTLASKRWQAAMDDPDLAIALDAASPAPVSTDRGASTREEIRTWLSSRGRDPRLADALESAEECRTRPLAEGERLGTAGPLGRGCP